MSSDECSNMGVEEVFQMYGDMLYHIAFVMLKNMHDAEDAVSDTLLKYIMNKKQFRDAEHRKAWLIRVNINICKNKLRFRARHPQIQPEQLARNYHIPTRKTFFRTNC